MGKPKSGQENPTVYKPAEVAKMLRCDMRTVYGMIERGELSSIKLGRVIRIPAAAVEALMAGEKPRAPKEGPPVSKES